MSSIQKAAYTAVAVILLAATGYLAYQHFHHSQNQSITQDVSNKPETPSVVIYAATGQVIDTFPQALLIGGSQTTQTSYQVSYSNGNQSTVVYDTPSSANDVYQQYLDYLKKNDYTLFDNQKSEKGDQASVFAIGQNDSISVQIATLKGGASVGQTHVNIAYFKR